MNLQDAINELAWYVKKLNCSEDTRTDGKTWREAFIEEVQVLVDAAKEEGRKEGMRECVAEIEAVPELPGEMPDSMWESIRNNREFATEAMRIAVNP